MQKTYESKKGRTGINVLDEKQCFEDYYIHNIKQAKRELSSIAVGNRKVLMKKPKPRRRKYVKRIVTDIEPYFNGPISKATCLTPDKSIHVKKNDLFDQLLSSTLTQKTNISPSNDASHKCYLNKKDNTVEASSLTKKYKRIKINFTSSSEDSDKENENKNGSSTRNVSDLRQHKLIIENDTKNLSSHDRSINNLVNNICLLKDLKPDASCVTNDMPCNQLTKHRLTENILEKDYNPTTSTPILKKDSRKTVYNLSPILFYSSEKSSKNYSNVKEYMPMKQVSDEVADITFDKKENFSKSIQNEICQECCIRDNSSRNPLAEDLSGNINDQLENGSEMISKDIPLNTSSVSDLKLITPGPHSPKSKLDLNISGNSFSEFKRESLKSNSGAVLRKSISSSAAPDITYFEPFYGFPDIPESSTVICEKNDGGDSTKPAFNDHKNSNKATDIFQNVVEHSESNRTTPTNSFYDTCSSLDPPDKDYDHLAAPTKEPRIYIQRLNDSLFQKYYQKMPSYGLYLSEKCFVEIENEYKVDRIIVDEYQSEANEDLLHSTDLPHSFCDNREENSRDEIGLNDDDFAQNLTIGKDVCDNVDIRFSAQQSLNLSNGSIKMRNCDTSKANDSNLIQNMTIASNVYEDEANEFTSQDVGDRSIPSEEDDPENEFEGSKDNVCISFITTRKRNDFTNNSVLMLLDDTDMGVISTDCDETIINTETYKPKGESDKDDSTDLVKNDAIWLESKDEEKIVMCKRGNSELKTPVQPEAVTLSEEMVAKPHIVLQPGKKWQRSLSMYKRMTSLNEQYDMSVLHEIPLANKGRNYRQSIIHTMEMQEFQGSPQHSDTFHRRSSFSMYRQSHSTIRTEPNTLRFSTRATSTFDGYNGFLSEDCDDTLIELSKLSIADAEHEVTVLEKVEEASVRVPSALDYVLRRCNQTEPVLFDECYPDTVLKNCRKIGEGVYGEVFLWRANDGRARIMKVVPVGGSTRINDEPQKDFGEIIAEIVIAMELSALRAPIALIDQQFDEGKDIDTLDLHTIENATDTFNEVLGVRCVYGPYPLRLLDLWDLYDECKGSDNDNPAILPRDQHYIVLELANAGEDLESFVFNNAEQAYHIFIQIAFALAVAEEAYQFEHRDLHWGNVLIASSDKKYCTFVLRGRTRRVPLQGVHATIIDYTLSRVSLPLCAGGAGGGAPGADSVTLYNDLAADESLFNAVGDYQYDIYRLMKKKLGNEWKNFEPYTNILWLHYTVDKMITAVRYKRTNTKIHKSYLTKLNSIKDRILEYGSAAEFVLTDNEFSMLRN